MATLSVFWTGEFHGQRSLADYSPWGLKELDTTEFISFLFMSCMSICVSHHLVIFYAISMETSKSVCNTCLKFFHCF